MRTTIGIDDDLYREVKERAARSGRTVAAVLEEAGCGPGVDLGSNAAVAEIMDEGASLDALR